MHDDVHCAEPVLERLGRIDALVACGAPPDQLRRELRELLRDAEVWSRHEGGEAGETAVATLRDALDSELVEA